MKSLLSNQKLLVAGAGGLLGVKVVKQALEQGSQVIAADINLELMTEKLVAQNIVIESADLELVSLDVTSESDVKNFFDTRSDITGAVNSTYPRNKAYGAHFFDVSLDSFNENLSLHLGSAFLFTQQCAAYFEKHKTHFSLVNISSIYGVVAPKFEIYDNTSMTMPVEYAAIKSAILHLNKYASAYVNDSRFRINSVSPGGIFDHQPSKFLEAYKSNTHGVGMLDVQEVVGSILFLLSTQSKFVTGQNIIVDDGFSL
ncbi:oxidoreductase [Vibrio splendidus]|uniref:oxidoreductase n=1 Tax=Vibrio splendidus TaxID=29497 RepID=UPI003D12F378